MANLLFYVRASGSAEDRNSMFKYTLLPLIDFRVKLRIEKLLTQVSTFDGVMLEMNSSYKAGGDGDQLLPVSNSNVNPWRRCDIKAITNVAQIAAGMRPKEGDEGQMGKQVAFESFLAWAETQCDGSLEGQHILFWGHGGGWRGLSEFALLIQSRFDFRNLPRVVAQKPLLVDGNRFRQAEYVSMQTAVPIDANDSLQPKELAAAFKRLLGAKKLGVIAFHSCLMSTIEVAYDLSDHASHMIASTGLLAHAGMPYVPWLCDPAIGANANAVEFAAPLFKAFEKMNPPKGRDVASVALVDLSRVRPIAVEIDAFVAEVFKASAVEQLRELLLSVREHECINFGGKYARTVDIAQFFGALGVVLSLYSEKRSEFFAVANAASNVQSAARSSVTMYYRSPTEQRKRVDTVGLTIFFPLSLEEATATYSFPGGWYEKGSSSSTFVDETKWRDFLKWIWNEK